MDDQNKNLILATVLSFVVIMGWYMLFPQPDPVVDPNAPAVTATATDGQAAAPPASAADPVATQSDAPTAAATAPRVTIDTPSLTGTISLLGGRIDDLQLKEYKKTLEPGSDIVRLLSPVGQENAYYALFGWGPAGSLDYADVPGANTEWTPAGGGTLSPGNPVTMIWNNGKGLEFKREISVDQDFMFTVNETVKNTGTSEARLFPYGIVARHGTPTDLEKFFISHEGVVRSSDGTRTEIKYDDVAKLPVVDREGGNAEVTDATADGWIGFTSKYWMTVLVPQQGSAFTSVVKYVPSSQIYQTEVRSPVVSVAPGASTTVSRPMPWRPASPWVMPLAVWAAS